VLNIPPSPNKARAPAASEVKTHKHQFNEILKATETVKIWQIQKKFNL